MENKESQTLTNIASLVQGALHDQRNLTAVERFSERHETGKIPEQARYYQDLIPLSTPRPGEQYAFEVDLDACTGCKACVSACHNLNGLDEKETWRSVGILNGGTQAKATTITVTTACHHCIEPACLTGCPTQAYVKDSKTGIVKHLDDQCFGCKYCTLTCPYEVPQYNPRLGIVRKCDMCYSRLNGGEAPACVQACPNQAIRIKVVKQKEVFENTENKSFLPGTPDPQKTYPTTNYKTKHPLPKNLLPADYYSIQKSHSHLPLVFMLVLTQLSIGAFTMKWITNFFLENTVSPALSLFLTILTFLLGQLAMGASIFHLGRPLYAVRAVIGLRTSWLSREIVAMGMFSFLTFGYALSFILNKWGSFKLSISFFNGLETITVFTGMCAIGTSVMVYKATKRDCWNNGSTAWKFYLSTFLSGSSFLLMILHLFAFFYSEAKAIADQIGGILPAVIIYASFIKLLIECMILKHLKSRHLTPLKRSAILLTRELKKIFKARLLCALVGAFIFPLFIILNENRESGSQIRMGSLFFSAASFLFVFAGEILERYLFFTSEGSDKMPGGFT